MYNPHWKARRHLPCQVAPSQVAGYWKVSESSLRNKQLEQMAETNHEKHGDSLVLPNLISQEKWDDRSLLYILFAVQLWRSDFHVIKDVGNVPNSLTCT